MKTFTITIKGKTPNDIRRAMQAAWQSIEDKNLSDLDRNNSGSYNFYSSGEYEEDANKETPAEQLERLQRLTAPNQKA